MEGMFRDARALNQDIGFWDVSTRRTSRREMFFRDARAFNQDLRRWDESRLRRWNGMPDTRYNRHKTVINVTKNNENGSTVPQNESMPRFFLPY
jgi:Mycoplasma protein of unknown function, DUF285